MLGEAAAERCPVCHVSLMHASLGGQRLRYCTRCRGMLIGMDVFVSLVQDLRSRADVAPGVPQAPTREISSASSIARSAAIAWTHISMAAQATS